MKNSSECFFKDVLTLGCTMEQTVAQMSIVNTVTWKQAPVWTVNLVTKTKGVDQVIKD